MSGAAAKEAVYKESLEKVA